MGKVIYDFREGLDKEKIIYNNTSFDCASFWKFVGFVLLSWGWMVGWFALFQFSYIFHPKTAFWVYVIVWLVVIVFFIAWVTYFLVAHYKKKNKARRVRQMKEDAENKEKLDTKQKNDLDGIELQNYRNTEQEFLTKNK
jgi:hypothetical protein